jgi:hypothetical protein
VGQGRQQALPAEQSGVRIMNPTQCPTCQSPEPRLHPAVSGGGEVTGICPDSFHDKATVPPETVAAISRFKREAQAAMRGDNEWHPPGFEGNMFDPDAEPIPYTIAEDVNMAAPIPPEYAAAHEFLTDVFGENGYTPDAVGQLVEVFIPCLRIMCDPDHPWDPEGKTWRRAGRLGVLTDARKKFERLWERYWIHYTPHPDSGYDAINFIAFVLRSDDNRWNEWGEPG